MSSLSSQPYKGTRDYYPAEKRIQNYIFNTSISIASRQPTLNLFSTKNLFGVLRVREFVKGRERIGGLC